MRKKIFLISLILIFSKFTFAIDINEPFYIFLSEGEKFKRMKKYEDAINSYEYAIYLLDKRIKDIDMEGNDLKNQKKKDLLLYYYASCNYNISHIYFEIEMDKQEINFFNIEIAKKELKISMDYLKQIFTKGPLFDFLYIKQIFLASEIEYIKDRKDRNGKVKELLQELINWFNNQAGDYSEQFSEFFARANLLKGLLLRESEWDSGSYLPYIRKSLNFSFKEDLCHYLLYEYYKSRNNENRTKQHYNKAISLNENIEKEFYNIFYNNTNIFDLVRF